MFLQIPNRCQAVSSRTGEVILSCKHHFSLMPRVSYQMEIGGRACLLFAEGRLFTVWRVPVYGFA